jgi:hypothetical protein
VERCPRTGQGRQDGDDYAVQLGHYEQEVPCGAVMVINPYAETEAGLVTLFQGPFEAVDYLTHARGRFEKVGRRAA